jgi:hypothetical protein
MLGAATVEAGCSNCIEDQGSALGTELGAANVDREFCRRKTKRLPLHVAETINRAPDDELLLRQVMSLQGPQGIVLPKDASEIEIRKIFKLIFMPANPVATKHHADGLPSRFVRLAILRSRLSA